MLRHFVSFVLNPVGYVLNFLATASCLLGDREPLWLEEFFANHCNTYCSRDGVQDDWHPLVPGAWCISGRGR
jgi:hypothetical protein